MNLVCIIREIIKMDLTDKEKKICIQKNCVIERIGMLGVETCLIPSKDYNKSCTDGKQCEYKLCQAKPNNNGNREILIDKTVEQPKSGKCAKYDNSFGCYYYFENGKRKFRCFD